MVKVSLRKKSKQSPAQIGGALVILAVIAVILTQQPAEDSRPSLLNLEATKDSSTTTAAATAAVGSNSGVSKPYVSKPVSGLEPAKCEALFEKGYRQAGAQKASDEDLNPNNDQMQARFAKDLAKKFWIAAHNEEFDEYPINSIFTNAQYNKTALTAAVLESLGADGAGGRVLDVGGQVGWFALLGRSLGAEVDVFDPVPANAFRICESLFLNKWSNYVEQLYPGPYVNVYNLAVSDQATGTLSMKQKGATASMSGGSGDAKDISVSTISLDEFVAGRKWTSETISVLKIDVNGMEDKVIAGALSLLKSKMVKNLLIRLVSQETMKQITSAGYKLHKWGGEIGPDQDAKADASALYSQLKAQKNVHLWFKKV